VDRAPETHYAKADDGVHIAYQVFGAGLFDLVVVPGFISHVELGWDDEAIAHALRRLGSFSRVILFDKRGTGMSDRPDQLPDIDRRMLDIEAVMQAAGSEQAAILAVSEGGPMALLFAATHPERARALVLLNAYARMTACPDYQMGLPAAQLYEFAQYVEPRWGTGVGLSAWAPSLAHDVAAREFFARLQRLAASPGAAMALMSSYLDIDVRTALSLVNAPTLVMHRTGDLMVPFAPITSGGPQAPHRSSTKSRSSSPVPVRCPSLTGCWPVSCSPTLSTRPIAPPSWETGRGGLCSIGTTPW
jgi:pimeloyl-ACP methyl ester carboxylesterase